MSLLTDQEIEGMGADNNYPGTVPGMQRFARAIEAAELKRLHDYDTRLTAVMPADFKDWRENSEREWPELAAWVITNLREQRDEANAEIERLKSTPPDQREDLRCVIADLMRQCQESDALLRQALDAMQWEVGGAPLPTLMMESIAAIKQHLEGKQ